MDDKEELENFEDLQAQADDGGATKACCQVLVFVTFLLLFSIVVLVDCDPFERYQQAKITQYFEGKFGAAVPPAEIATHGQLLDYIENGFLNGLLGNESDMPPRESDVVPTLPSLGGDEWSYNRLLGAVQLRTLKVRPGSAMEGTCGARMSYAAYFDMCVPEYRLDENEQKEPVESQSSTPYEYSESVSTPLEGEFASYGTGGYVQYLNANRTYSKLLISDLINDNYFDITTRLVLFDFTLWNANLGVFVPVRLAFEISPIGVWSFHSRVLIVRSRFLSFSGGGSAFEWAMAIAESLLLLFLLYYVAEELSELWVSASDYLQDGWNLIDWFSLLLMIWMFYVRFLNYIDASNSDLRPGLDEVEDHTFYTNFQVYGERIADARRINAFNMVLIWLKVVKYIPFLPYAKVLYGLFGSSGALFVSFFFIFAIFFVGFGLAFNVGFGMVYAELQSWPVSWVYLGRSLLGDADVAVVYRLNPVSGTLLIFLFIIGIHMALLNMWYALVLHAFSLTREQIVSELDAKDEKPPIEKFVEKVVGFIRDNVDYKKLLGHFPGLHARTVEKWRRENTKLEKRKGKRIALEEQRSKAQKIDRARSGYTLMPFNSTAKDNNVTGHGLGVGPSAGALENVTTSGLAAAKEDLAPESEHSDDSLDLGPMSPFLIRDRKKWKRRMGADENIVPNLDELDSAIESIGNQILSRVQHIGTEVRDEMAETKEVLAGMNDVLGVVNRRLKDLAVVQEHHL